MLNQKQILEYAIIGVTKEIDELEKTVNQGKQYLLQHEKGQNPKTPKTPQEINAIIDEKKTEIEKLAKLKDELKWALVEFEQ